MLDVVEVLPAGLLGTKPLWGVPMNQPSFVEYLVYVHGHHPFASLQSSLVVRSFEQMHPEFWCRYGCDRLGRMGINPLGLRKSLRPGGQIIRAQELSIASHPASRTRTTGIHGCIFAFLDPR